MPDRRRAAIYARYSTDLQRERSIADQVALCRDHARKAGLTVVATYSDQARTSASLIGRDGAQDMLADARAGNFDVLVVEALDRLSRDQEDLAHIHRRLDFAGVSIETAGAGTADALQIGVHGLLGQIWMGEHKKKVRRGQAGVLRDGRHPGGRAYGYRPRPGAAGALDIVEGEAEVVRRIFAAYAAGDSPRTIAGALNAEAVPAPRGARWNASTLNGNSARGYGILGNDIYRGRLVWNRVRMVLDPETGRRVSRVNAIEDWMTAEAPQLRIVPEDLWDAVQARRCRQSRTGPGRRSAAPLRLLSGLLRCGCCGGGLSIQKQDRGKVWIRCSTARESGACENRTRPRLDLIEVAIVARLADELRRPVYVKAYLDEYHAERQRLAAEARRDHVKLERRATRARAAFDRARRLYIEGVTDGDEAKAEIGRLQAEARAAEAALAAGDTAPPRVELHPASAARYLAALADLSPRLGGDLPREAVETLRGLISEVVVTPSADGHDVEVTGYIGALLGDLGGQSVVAEGRSALLPTMPILRTAI